MNISSTFNSSTSANNGSNLPIIAYM
jgi:hypothetical protein